MGRTAIVLMAASLAAGCGVTSKPEASETPVINIPPRQASTKIVGATPKQHAVLTKILAGLGPTSVKVIELVEPEKDWGAPANAAGLNIQIPKDDRLAYWHADLIADAFHQRSHELGLPPVAFVSAGRGGHALGKDPYRAREVGDPGLTLAQARDIAERIRKAAAQNNAKVRRLELLRPRRFAFVVVLQADDPAEFLFSGYEDVIKPLDDLRARGYDGRYTEVLDGEEKPVMGSGGWFFDVTGCAHVVGLGSIRDPGPPPCPAASR